MRLTRARSASGSSTRIITDRSSGVYRAKVAALEQALANPMDKAEAIKIVAMLKG